MVDGNMKNRRNVCAAAEAGYIHFSSLPGSIKTGCQLSPPSSSKYCYHHAPRVSAGLLLEKKDVGSESPSSPTHEGIIQYIVSKVKTTRDQTYYEV